LILSRRRRRITSLESELWRMKWWKERSRLNISIVIK